LNGSGRDNPDPGIFEGILSLLYWQYCKGSSLWILQQFQNTQAGGPQIEYIKGSFGGGLR